MKSPLEPLTRFSIQSGSLHGETIYLGERDGIHEFICKADELVLDSNLCGRYTIVYCRKTDFLCDGITLTFTQVPRWRLIPSGSDEERAFWHLYQSLPVEVTA